MCEVSEETAANPTVKQVLASLARHPLEHLIYRWNWKSALTSAIMRGLIFFFTNLSAGLDAATGALLADASFRILISGFYGSATQAFRKAEPAWAAGIFVMVVLPLTSHGIEFLVHSLRGTPKLLRGVAVSVAFTVVATLFNFYAMRRGVLVVGETGRKTFRDDMREMPSLLAGFLAWLPLSVWRALTQTPNRS
jgi:hypothetical protein